MLLNSNKDYRTITILLNGENERTNIGFNSLKLYHPTIQPILVSPPI